MPNATQLLADQTRPFADFPTETITISGTDYECLVLNFTEGNEWGEGGRVDESTIQVAIERGDIDANIPVQGTEATFRSSTYRIAQVDSDDKQASVVLDLEHTTLRS